MIKLYSAPRTRSVRILGLFEELGLRGDEFSAADIMMGFTLIAAKLVGVLDERYPALQSYLERLLERPALRKVIELTWPRWHARQDSNLGPED